MRIIIKTGIAIKYKNSRNNDETRPAVVRRNTFETIIKEIKAGKSREALSVFKISRSLRYKSFKRGAEQSHRTN